MKIAVASSGLGHIARGIETWAWDTACTLHGRPADVSLFGAGTAPGNIPDGMPYVALACRRRFEPETQRLVKRLPGFLWRWGLKSPHGFEQFSFWLHLWPYLRRGRYDVLHVQDPMLARWCRAFRRLGLISTRELLAHGTNEEPGFLAKFDFVQHLAPCRKEEVLAELRRTLRAGRIERLERQWVAIPNFVDTNEFRAVADEAEKRVIRERLGLPPDAFIVGTVAMVEKRVKRIDYLIREFGSSDCRSPIADAGSQRAAYLLVVGAHMGESDQLEDLAAECAPGRVRFLYDQPRDRMPDIYRAMDVFVLTSLFEMMPVALLEAMASGIPVLTHELPVLQWMVGQNTPEPAGNCINMAAAGTLARALADTTPKWLSAHSAAAKDRACNTFAKDVVIDQYIEYYQKVMGPR